MTNSQDTFWNAEVYERIGKPMREWAQAVIRDLDLRGDETVLDAGCGSGSVTFDLAEQLPNGKIYALDSSEEMIEEITRAIAERQADRIIPICASLTGFRLPEQVDVVFSNAVFHWIADDDALFGALFQATKHGGRLRAQCGGAGNIHAALCAAHVVQDKEPFAQYIRDVRESTTFRTPERTEEAMRRAGWQEIRASLFDAPVEFDSHEEAALYLRTIILREYVSKLPDEMAEPFLLDVIAECERQTAQPFSVGYVRLNIWATRPE